MGCQGGYCFQRTWPVNEMKRKTKKLKLCFAASAGGHWEQLLKISETLDGYDVFYVSSLNVAIGKLKKNGPSYIVGDCNREHPFKTLSVFFRCLRIAYRERPDVIISTGAAPGFLMCMVGRILGSKVIWIDSIANTSRLSMSGRMSPLFASLILTQWPEVANRNNNVEYAGELI